VVRVRPDYRREPVRYVEPVRCHDNGRPGFRR
jgi:hypothetical protein